MISRRSILVACLLLIPVLTYAVAGGYALWTTGLFAWVWWMAPACWLLAWGLAWFWRLGQLTQPSQDLPVASHWTARDQQAALIVREYQQKVEQLPPDKLTDLQHYQTEVQSLAIGLARRYHPEANDPLTSLTIPEILAAVRLAVDDLEQWTLTSVPGSRLLTINHWRKLQSAPKWIRRFQNTAWAVSILLNPANIASYLASKLTVDPVTSALQTELLGALYLRFFQLIGFYLIEMNSGRLRGGSEAYRRAFPLNVRRKSGSPEGQPSFESAAAGALTIAMVGQVSSGKSSLVNAMTGSQQAAVDILPETLNVERYQMTVGVPAVVVTLLDTPGYAEIGATKDQLQQIQAALREANVVLFVLDAHSPAREADRRTLGDLENWYVSQPRFKLPPMLGVLTHIDLLRPTLEWSPPYDWREPSGPKAQNIHDAVAYTRELFGGSLAAVVPVCADADPQRAWGILDEVVPALTLILDEGQSTALLRAFEQQLDQDRLKTLLKQIRLCGSDLFRCWIDERMQSDQDQSPAGNR
ncbi:MAG: hypothetical protein EXS05_18985 [Planctomycetaceae bacterium]|nr:hypothetical protein [Planctomycetaceae bacterium]